MAREPSARHLVKVSQVRGTLYLSPLGNHRPDVTAYSLLFAFVKLVPNRLKREARHKAQAYGALFGVEFEDNCWNWDARVLLYESYRGFFAKPYTPTGIPVKLACHSTPKPLAEESDLAVAIIILYFGLVVDWPDAQASHDKVRT